jgi:glycosyltransferase involved in cell wall biosynthesis
VLTQEFDDYEYIVIDGGSFDGTLNIIEKYHDQLVYWHSKPDRGLAHAFNQGIQNSRGKWLIFLNSDDFFSDVSVLGKLADSLRCHPENDVIFGQIIMVSRESVPHFIGGPYGKPFDWRRFVLVNDVLPHPAAATNRDLFERIGLFSEDMSISLDHEIYLRAGRTLRAKFIKLQVTSMRVGGMSTLNIRESLRHAHLARVATRTLPPPISCLLYYYRFSSAVLGRAILKILKL